MIATPDPNGNSADPNPATSSAPYRLYNIGNHQPVKLLTFIEAIEKTLGMKAKKNMLPMQPGDLLVTCADITSLQSTTGFRPSTPIDVGVQKFVD